uniref:BSD domain-containing protein n=2 Tax=Opuntia streptacantha TaxID=393608 RepID=A0A7C8YI24_OPUST
MDFWSKARSFAEEAAKRSQELTMEAAKRSQELTSTIRIPEIVSETAKRSKEIAAEASNQIKAEALKRADLIKSISLLDPASSSEKKQQVSEEELERYGVTEELREFVKGITMSTFQDFPLQDDAPVSDVATVSNVRQDLTEWQARHATLMLSTVKEISKLRYELCPRIMKERKFWRIYFLLVNNHIARYENKYMEEAKLKAAEQEKDDKAEETGKDTTISKPEGAKATQPLKKATSSSEQDLDVFLLGDLGDSDDGPDDVDGDDGFDDDFDKIGDSSEDERAKDSQKQV